MSFESRETEAARRVLIELMQLLGEYRGEMVIVGGWVPYLHIGEPHVGSMDVDIALNGEAIDNEKYGTIKKILEGHGYSADERQPFMFYREVKIDDGGPIVVEIDFLAGEYGGTGRKHRTQLVQDIRARKARGCDLAFAHPVSMKLSGTMPDGAHNSVVVNVCGLVPFIVMKGMALYDRLKEKDAYDVYFCLKRPSEDIGELKDQFRSVKGHNLVVEGLSKIRSKFETVGSMGPSAVAQFMSVEAGDERTRLARDAFETVRRFLDDLGIRPFQS